MRQRCARMQTFQPLFRLPLSLLPPPPTPAMHIPATSAHHTHHSSSASTIRTPHRLLLSLFLFLSTLALVHAQPYVGLSFPSEFVSTYGDTPLTTPLSIHALGGSSIVVSSWSVLDPLSFIQFSPASTLPPSSIAVGSPHEMVVLLDARTVVAGNYTQQFNIVGRRNGPGAVDETASATITVQVLAGVLHTTNSTSLFSPHPNLHVPFNMTEGSDFSQSFALRSRPAAEVRINIVANEEWGEIQPAVGPQGQPLSGGGSLLLVDPQELVFTPDTWSTPQWVRFRSSSNDHMQGSRWCMVDYDFSSSDMVYDEDLIPSLNHTIIEKDWAVLRVKSEEVEVRRVVEGKPWEEDLLGAVETGLASLLRFTATPGFTLPLSFHVWLGAQPHADVLLTLPDAGRYTLTPNTLRFTSADWDQPQQVLIEVHNSTVLIGRKVLTQSFPTVTSMDADFEGLRVPSLEATFLDALNRVASISPPFASFLQTGSTTTWLTLSYAPPRTFLPSRFGERDLPTVQCVFGNVDLCSDPNDFYGAGRAGCENPYAQVVVPGRIMSPTQMQCPIPGCPSILGSTAANPGKASENVLECEGEYRVLGLINGQSSSVALPFTYILTVAAAERRQPIIDSISPSTIDVNKYEWIEVQGRHFDTALTYPNPTRDPALPAETEGLSDLSLVACRIAGAPAAAVDISLIATRIPGSNPDDHTGTIRCLSRPRPDLAGGTERKPVLVSISLNGQEYTDTSGGASTVNLYDYNKKAETNAWTFFFVGVALVGLVFAAMLLQHFLCANFFRTHEEEEEDTKERVLKGPQALIDLLAPQVLAQTILIQEQEKAEARMGSMEAEAAEQVKARIAEIQREAQRQKEEKKRQKFEKKLAKEAAKIAEAARQEVLSAAGLAPEVEMGESNEKEEKKKRKKEKEKHKEKQALLQQRPVSASPPAAVADYPLESEPTSPHFSLPDAAASPSGGAPRLASPSAAPVPWDSALDSTTAFPVSLQALPDSTVGPEMELTALQGVSADLAPPVSSHRGDRSSRKKSKKDKEKKHKRRSSAAVADMGDMGVEMAATAASSSPEPVFLSAAAAALDSARSQLESGLSPRKKHSSRKKDKHVASSAGDAKSSKKKKKKGTHKGGGLESMGLMSDAGEVSDTGSEASEVSGLDTGRKSSRKKKSKKDKKSTKKKKKE